MVKEILIVISQYLIARSKKKSKDIQAEVKAVQIVEGGKV